LLVCYVCQADIGVPVKPQGLYSRAGQGMAGQGRSAPS
jgi:hypothetical protein